MLTCRFYGSEDLTTRIREGDILYPNLTAERKKRKVTIKMIADLFSGRQATISYKLKHHKFYIDEAMLIRDTFFPDKTINYLFKTDEGVRK